MTRKKVMQARHLGTRILEAWRVRRREEPVERLRMIQVWRPFISGK